MKRYAVHGGYVVSRSDFDIHFVTAHQVARLYGLRYAEWFPWDAKYSAGMQWEDYKHLGPRDDGDYTLENR